jgi:two-component system, chemotaxis family, response regulator PixG
MNNQFQISRIQYFSWKQFSGELQIQSDQSVNWSLFFQQGKLIWAKGGIHPYRLWLRSLIKGTPELVGKISQLPPVNDNSWGQYQLLQMLVKQKHLTANQALTVITNVLTELLFDITQQSFTQELTYSYDQKKIISFPVALFDTEQVLKQVNDIWEEWRKAGLAKVSPNLAPVIRQADKLEHNTPKGVYQNFVKVMDGKNTLRDLSSQLNQDTLLLTRSLVGYIRQGIIGLIEIQDLTTLIVENPKFTETPKTPTNTHSAPLIACVDDSPQTCKIMQQIFVSAGYRFVGIQNPVEALPILLERKPDIIFLDLMMPVVNGYEICSQLRRVPIFAHTPMIILTGSDGLIDRVRSKVVGASDFLTKPVEAYKVLAAVNKYLHPTDNDSNTIYTQLKAENS